MKQLQDFIQTLAESMRCAQRVTGLRWPGVQIVSMQVQLAATVEAGDAHDTLALRIGAEPQQAQALHALSIEVPGNQNEAIVVHLDGQLVGHYGSHGDAQAN
ncbi:hypothetical protein RTH46_09570 [Pseudomonas sp. zfem004]|uniref:hypothetical protein n=1 Tax=unclassified Pseudomonas TaxID=196821 RepID=UPI00129B6C2C|nr:MULTISPECIES: hypothetical protein [unclassified Pseudomonas]MDU9402740.1 hypothetical protein [Pseudomonas sp. zfem004]